MPYLGTGSYQYLRECFSLGSLYCSSRAHRQHSYQASPSSAPLLFLPVTPWVTTMDAFTRLLYKPAAMHAWLMTSQFITGIKSSISFTQKCPLPILRLRKTFSSADSFLIRVQTFLPSLQSCFPRLQLSSRLSLTP